jgi:hypothetical protein
MATAQPAANPWDADPDVEPWAADEDVAPAKRGGIARNIAAGGLEGAGGAIDAAINPSGTLGKMAVTAGLFGYDALAPVFGYQRSTPEMRDFLLNDDPSLSPGASIAQAAGAGDVAATTHGERLARAGGAGAASLAPTKLALTLPGAVGGVVAEEAGDWVPDWAKPMTQLAANVFGVGAAAGGAHVGRKAINKLSEGVNRWANDETPPATPPNALTPPEVAPAAGGAAPAAAEGAPAPQPAGAQASTPAIAPDASGGGGLSRHCGGPEAARGAATRRAGCEPLR